MNVALYQPEIPQNVGSMVRTAACLGFHLHIIQPCGFPMSARDLKRTAMDYRDHLKVTLHDSFSEFQSTLSSQRLVLLTTKTDQSYTKFKFQSQDVLLLGQESSGVPEEIHASVAARITIPMTVNCRSLNVAMAGGIIMSEMRRQLLNI